MSKRKRAPRPVRAFGYAVAIVVNMIIWYIVHNLDTLNIRFILVEEFSRVLPALRLSLGASIIAYACFLVFDPPVLRRGVQVLLNLLSLNVLWRLYQVVPYDFGSETLNSGLRTILLLAMVCVGIGTVVAVFRVPFGRED